MSSMFPLKNPLLRTVLPYPAVVVHDLAQANAALCEGLALTLLSATGAASFAGMAEFSPGANFRGKYIFTDVPWPTSL